MKVTTWLSMLVPAAALADGLVGSTIPPYPVGLVHNQGACIVDECDFSIGILEDSSGLPKTLFAARIAGHDDAGRARWTITDAMPYPALPEGYLLAIATCESDGKKDETIVAAVRLAETEWLEDVIWVRRYVVGTAKFVEHPGGGVRCLNEGWGL
ncbi:MAG TPA: hypothetical protein VFS23_30595 [Vicinamibacterales bacterium]|nr:hypothetical protein [Vicinamibacterales bacterium]